MVKVNIQWKWIEWNVGDTWKRNVLPKLKEEGIREEDLERCVYVIRASGLFAIEYPQGVSPTLYIGQGNFRDRIMQHKNWLSGIVELVSDYSFEIGVCIPRVKKRYDAYLDLEAAVIEEFRSIYGCAPLKNAKIESRKYEYEYVPKGVIRNAIMIGKGNRYGWAIRPMPSHKLYSKYFKTCD